MAAPNTESLSLDTLEIVAGPHYEKNGYPHAEWTYLRKNAPVYWYDRPNVDPFWAITKHADIVEVSTQPRVFLNGPRLLIFPRQPGEEPAAAPPFRHLLDMDP